MRRGRWRGGCGGSFAADASSTSVPDTACSPRSCCCSTILRRARSSSTRHCRPRAPNCTRCWCRPGRGCPDASTFVASALEDVEILQADVVVSSHACGALTDLVLDRAVAAQARVAVLPCCHDLASGDAGGLSGWVDGPVAIDIVRAMRLTQQGYRIWTQAIPPRSPRRTACCSVPL